MEELAPSPHYPPVPTPLPPDDPTAPAHACDPSEHFSIGRAASVSGISSATLRMWERRYGRPVPVRLPSGHRRFTCDQVRWLKRVSEALARGARASDAVQATEAELDALLLTAAVPHEPETSARDLLDLARGYEGRQLVDELRANWDDLGPRDFLLQRIVPFIVQLGRAWADGRIETRHEHHATAHIDDMLRTLRGSLPMPTRGPRLLLTTLPGECHGLGLQMVALLAATEDVRTCVLGTESPIEEIVAAARESGSTAVGISVSLCTGGPDTDRSLTELRCALPEDICLVVGGAGSRGPRRGPRRIEYVADLQEMHAWLTSFRAASPR